jgi:hypothetical protein
MLALLTLLQIRVAAPPAGYLFKLTILVLAVGGCILIQLVIITWICLFWLQTKLLLVTAALLAAALEREELVNSVSERLREAEENDDVNAIEDDGLAISVHERLREAEEHDDDANAIEEWGLEPEQYACEGLDFGPREHYNGEWEEVDPQDPFPLALSKEQIEPQDDPHLTLSKDEQRAQKQREFLAALASEASSAAAHDKEETPTIPWGCTPDQLAEAANFAKAATKGISKHSNHQGSALKKPTSTAPLRARPQSRSFPKPRTADISQGVAQVQLPSLKSTFSGDMPPHLRKAKEARESRFKTEHGSENVQPDVSTLVTTTHHGLVILKIVLVFSTNPCDSEIDRRDESLESGPCASLAEAALEAVLALEQE